VCSADQTVFEKDRHECWNAILSVSAINMDDKALPQFQQLALETKGRFFKTKNPDEIAERMMDIGNSLGSTSVGGFSDGDQQRPGSVAGQNPQPEANVTSVS
jgi:hypothetical protein